MTRCLAYVMVMMICGLPGAAVSAQSADADAAAVQDDFATLKEEFNRVATSLLNKREIEPGDHPLIERLRERMRTYAAAHPTDVRPHAAIQLISSWLDDDEAADAAFEQIVRLSPDDADLANSLATKLKTRSRYDEAISVLTRGGVDLTASPQAAITLASLYYAQNRFDEAIATLEAVNTESADVSEFHRTRIANQIKQYGEVLEQWIIEQELRDAEAEADDLPRVELVTTDGRVVVELFENEAPNTVANFINLVEGGEYDDRVITEVRPDNMTVVGEPQKPDASDETADEMAEDGVDAREDGSDDALQAIPNENEGDVTRKHFAGTIGMSLSDGPNTARSAFYIGHTPMTWMDTQHTAFGRVVEGLDIILRLTEDDDRIVSAKVIRKRDHDYPVQYYDPATASPVESAGPTSIGEGVTVIEPESSLSNMATPVPVDDEDDDGG